MDAARQQYQRQYREKNRERLLAKKREYYLKNRDQILARIDQNRARKRSYDRRYHRRNRDRDRTKKLAYQSEYRSIPENRLAHNLRNRLSKFLKRRSGRKSTEALLGCTFAEFRHYIEARFRPGMTWGNYGSHWHLDHIVPISAFDLADPDQIRRCFHFSNLRPLSAGANLRKGNRITHPQLPLGL